MAEAQSFELLKTKRKSLRTAVTKIVNELETELSNSDLNVDRLCELTTLSQSQDEHFRNTDNIRIKVPKYHITRFYGDDAENG
ncbi:hypothetical protein TNCV_4166181 [Trichonephila clavipes]|nr:hypothetical protein TNCV_4166181 [Trichonephila clavipes]